MREKVHAFFGKQWTSSHEVVEKIQKIPKT
jgi:hypothetical protein